MSCNTGFYSAAGVANLNDDACSSCGALLGPVTTLSTPPPLALEPIAAS